VGDLLLDASCNMTIYGGTLVRVAQAATIRTEGTFHAIGSAQSPIGGQNSFTQYQQYAIVLQDNSIDHR
jgi:hypothetical protein